MTEHIVPPYFDINRNEHMAMLPEPYDRAPGLAQAAAKAEADVLVYYTETSPIPSYDYYNHMGGVFVYYDETGEKKGTNARIKLRGFKHNPEEVDTEAYPTFKDDMARTIAAVVIWQLQQNKRSVDVDAESDNRGKSATLSSGRLSPYPPNWDRWLREYDLTTENWHL